MSTLDTETEIGAREQAADRVELIDCGRASQRTQGFSLYLLFEGGIPPANRFPL